MDLRARGLDLRARSRLYGRMILFRCLSAKLKGEVDKCVRCMIEQQLERFFRNRIEAREIELERVVKHHDRRSRYACYCIGGGQTDGIDFTWNKARPTFDDTRTRVIFLPSRRVSLKTNLLPTTDWNESSLINKCLHRSIMIMNGNVDSGAIIEHVTRQRIFRFTNNQDSCKKLMPKRVSFIRRSYITYCSTNLPLSFLFPKLTIRVARQFIQTLP